MAVDEEKTSHGMRKPPGRAKLWLQKAAAQTEEKHARKEAEKILREYF